MTRYFSLLKDLNFTGVDYHAAFQEHHAVAKNTQEACLEAYEKLVSSCLTSIASGGKLLFFGNGGSAGDAQHLATELTVRFGKDRPAIPAIALTTDTSALTAIGNDFSFEEIFSRQIEAIGNPGDVAIGITTSGQSPNVERALKVAKERGLTPAAFGGKDGGKLMGLADPYVVVPSQTTARIQEMHITLGQLLCSAIEKGLGLV
ncbi:D-sedoheptulose 7-phosphate isomerase [Alphaproteobacteria bacterium]|nr:D-sedoheptulose 7-phosphate isomerase [Alphaproteobacteria bacterium]